MAALFEKWIGAEENEIQVITIGWELRVRADENIGERIDELKRIQAALQKAKFGMTIVIDQKRCADISKLYFKNLAVEQTGHDIKKK